MLLHSISCHVMHQRCLVSNSLIWRISQTKCFTKTRLEWSSAYWHQEKRTTCYCKRENDQFVSGLGLCHDPNRRISTNPQAQHANPSKWTKTIVKAGLLACAVLGVLLAGLTYRTIENINNTLSVFSDRHHDEHWPYSYLNLNKQALLIPWLQLYCSDLATLLELCQSEDRNMRQLGVCRLAAVEGWPDWEYYLASMLIDTRTLIGLARTEGANTKLFPRSPRILSLQDNVLSELQTLLSKLPTDDVDKCTEHFTSVALRNKPKIGPGKTMMWTFDENDFLQLEPVTSIKEDQNRQLHVLLALEGHSQLLDHSLQIVEEGGLELLKHLCENCANDKKMVQHIAHILSQLTQYDVLHRDIADSGWVTILADWIQSDDFPLSVYAAKALANLDQDFGEPWLYPDSVYLYYPQFRSRYPINADVVFIHGLLGGPFRTWRQNDFMNPERQSRGKATTSKELGKNRSKKLSVTASNATAESLNDETETEMPYTMCWPKDWLAKDCPNLRILTVDYESYLSEWTPKCPYENERRTLATRSRELLEKLRESGLGTRPIIWVAHSMGGLLVKQMLLLARQDGVMSDVVHQTKGVIFYSVPHKGSPLSVYMSRTKYLLYPSAEVKLLYEGSKELLELHKKFKSLMSSTCIPLLSFGEGSKTNLPFNMRAMFVPVESSDPGFGEFYVMKDESHLTICKPINRQSMLYKQTLNFITSCIPQCKRVEICGNDLQDQSSISDR